MFHTAHESTSLKSLNAIQLVAGLWIIGGWLESPNGAKPLASCCNSMSLDEE